MRPVLVAVMGLGLALALGCGSDPVGPHGDLVGGGCLLDRDCDVTCLTNSSHYPGGMCTVRCDSDAQCPRGSLCVDDAGGVCAVACVDAGDCSAFGRGYTCNEVGRKGASGDTFVCRVD